MVAGIGGRVARPGRTAVTFSPAPFQSRSKEARVGRKKTRLCLSVARQTWTSSTSTLALGTRGASASTPSPAIAGIQSIPIGTASEASHVAKIEWTDMAKAKEHRPRQGDPIEPSNARPDASPSLWLRGYPRPHHPVRSSPTRPRRTPRPPWSVPVAWITRRQRFPEYRGRASNGVADLCPGPPMTPMPALGRTATWSGQGVKKPYPWGGTPLPWLMRSARLADMDSTICSLAAMLKGVAALTSCHPFHFNGQ